MLGLSSPLKSVVTAVVYTAKKKDFIPPDCPCHINSPLPPVVKNPPMILPLVKILCPLVTGRPDGPVLFCWMAYVVCNAAGGRTDRPRGRLST